MLRRIFMRCAPSLTPKQKRESDDFPILRHGFAVPPPLPKEANVTAGLRRHFVGDDAHIVPELTQTYSKFPRNAEDSVPYRSCVFVIHQFRIGLALCSAKGFKRAVSGKLAPMLAGEFAQHIVTFARFGKLGKKSRGSKRCFGA